MDVQLSSYANCLSSVPRKRYIEKISKINFLDPYSFKKSDLDFSKDAIPAITYPDICNYLLFAPSPYTADELKCYKSLDAFNYFVSGFYKGSWRQSFW